MYHSTVQVLEFPEDDADVLKHVGVNITVYTEKIL
jgi:hypothetical protein